MICPLSDMFEVDGLVGPKVDEVKEVADSLATLLNLDACFLAISSSAQTTVGPGSLGATNWRGEIEPYFRGRILKAVVTLKFSEQIPPGTSFILFSPYSRSVARLDAEHLHNAMSRGLLGRLSRKAKSMFATKKPRAAPKLDYRDLAAILAEKPDKGGKEPVAGEKKSQVPQATEVVAELPAPEPREPERIDAPRPEEQDISLASSEIAVLQHATPENSPGGVAFELELNSALLPLYPPDNPAMWLSIRTASDAIFMRGIRVPRECAERMIFLASRPGSLTIDPDDHDPKGVAHRLVEFARSDHDTVRMSPSSQEKLPVWLSVFSVSDAIMRFEFDMKILRNAMKTKDFAARHLVKMIDRKASQPLWTKLPILINAGMGKHRKDAGNL